jgi:hypothetical protein
MSLGYAKPLYILPFEHRGPFQKGMFGWSGTLTAKQTAEIGQAKRVIYDGVNPRGRRCGQGSRRHPRRRAAPRPWQGEFD